MPIFEPVYRERNSLKALLSLQQKQGRSKRKRDFDATEDSDSSASPTGSPTSQPTPRAGPGTFLPINRTDPYHVAGISRAESLPAPPFPHAAIRDSDAPRDSTAEDLATLHPPIFVPSAVDDSGNESTSLRRRHLDNLTAILHTCMSRNDWNRAFRAWGLILRTEIKGRAIDIRRNGRWEIGAMLIMRKHAQQDLEAQEEDDDPLSRSKAGEAGEDPVLTEKGFELAKEYYERFILQYPHTSRTQHLFNAVAVYPALFNVWIYQVHYRSRQASEGRGTNDDQTGFSSFAEDGSDHSRQVWQTQITSLELEGAVAIAQRMDNLLLSPPYDTSAALLEMRGMVALWMADLHEDLSVNNNVDVDGQISAVWHAEGEAERDESRSETERTMAKAIFAKLAAMRLELPEEVREMAEEWLND